MEDVVEIDLSSIGRSKQLFLESNSNVYVYIMQMKLDNGYKMVSHVFLKTTLLFQ